MKRRFGTASLVFALLLALLPATVLTAEAAPTVDSAELEYYEIPLIDPRIPTEDGDPDSASSGIPFPESEEVVDDSELEYFEIPLIDPRYPPANVFDNTENNPNAVQPADRRAALCIDRLKLPQFARNFYNIMEAESKPAGSSAMGRDGVLIDPSQATERCNFTNGTAYVLTIPYPSEAELKRAGFAFEDLKEYVRNCMHAAYYAFDRDHPEVFWLGGYSSYDNTRDRIYNIVLAYEGFPADRSNWDIRDDKYQDAGKIKKNINALNQSVSSIVSAASRLPSNYEKVSYFNEWLTTKNQYNYTVAYTNDSADKDVYESIGALTTLNSRPGGRIGVDGPVCSGYARAFMLLCREADIPCVVVTGAGHAWNYVQVDPSDSRWYAMDVTWNDPVMSGKPTEAEYTGKGANSGSETTAYTLVGADTIVYPRQSETFLERHPEENQVSGGGYIHAIYKMGPQLNKLAYVDSVTVTGLDVPVKNAVPDTTASLTSSPKSHHHPTSSGTEELLINPVVTWSPALINGKFAPDTSYTATITYQPLRKGYGLSAADASKISVAGAERITVSANGAIQAVFPGGEPLIQAKADEFTGTLPANLVYDGASKTAAVRSSVSSAIHNGYFTLTFTDAQNKPVTNLVKPGTYHVSAQVSPHGKYTETTVSLGSVTIRESSGLHGKVSISIGDSSSQEHNGTAYVVSDIIITIHVSPDPGYQLDTLQVIRADNGRQVSLSGSGAAYTFRMPASDVSIQATFSVQP